MTIEEPERKPLIFTDPERFQTVVLADGQAARLGRLHWLDDMAICELVRHGIRRDDRSAAEASAFYRAKVAEAPEDVRNRIRDHVATIIRTMPSVSARALVPFILDDPAPIIVTPAIDDYVSFAPIENGDPLTRPREVMRMIERGAARSPGAVFGGLLQLGDPRVSALIRPLRDRLAIEALGEAIKCSSGLIHSAVTEFYLDWLEDLVAAHHDPRFRIAATGLIFLKTWNELDGVVTASRPFPAGHLSAAELNAALPLSPLADHVEEIAPRLRALERQEPAPKLMPHVLAAWGLEPETAAHDTASHTAFMPLATQPNPREVIAIPQGRFVDIDREWRSGMGGTFLLYGTLKLPDPTLLAVGMRAFGGTCRLFLRWFHILGGNTTYAPVGRSVFSLEDLLLGIGELHNYRQATRRHGLPATIPSFLVPGTDDPQLRLLAKTFLEHGAAGRADWGRELAYISAFGTDFFGRAGCELRVALEEAKTRARTEGRSLSEAERLPELVYANWPAFRDARPPAFTSSPLTSELFDAWWSLTNRPDYRQAAFDELREMWATAIAPLPERTQTVPFEEIEDFLERYPCLPVPRDGALT